MNAFITSWKRPLRLWLLSLVLFLALSAAMFLKGGDAVVGIADAFHHNRASNMLANQQYHAAAKEYTAWLWLDPENADRLYHLAEVHLLEEQPHQAYFRIEPIAKSMQPDSFDTCRIMALIQVDREPEAALGWATRASAVADDDQQASALLVQAHVLRVLGRVPEAIEFYRKLVGLDPDHPEARYYLAEPSNQEPILNAFAKRIKLPSDVFNPDNCTPEFIRKAGKLAKS